MNMNLTDEMRKEASRLPLIVGLVSLGVGTLLSLAGSSWNDVFLTLGILLIAYGLWYCGTMAAIWSFSMIPDLASRHALSNWDGEVLHMDGDQRLIRYKFGHDGNPRFIASDICIAIGVKPPAKDANRWGGAVLLNNEGQICFSRESVQEFLSPLVLYNHEAKRLLVKLRNEVFRKQDKERENS